MSIRKIQKAKKCLRLIFLNILRISSVGENFAILKKGIKLQGQPQGKPAKNSRTDVRIRYRSEDTEVLR